MVTEVVRELEAARAKVAELENSLAKAQKQKLAGLPKEYGFDNLADFIKAIKGAGTGPRRGRGAAKSTATASAPSSKKQRSKRARITPEVKEKVKSAVNAGKTGAEIAKEFGISVPSVQNIKKEFGLVKARS